jgi:hypothetical protein
MRLIAEPVAAEVEGKHSMPQPREVLRLWC